ncbi:hypothetical protein [Streptomyces tateyamensis]|nr:hypothetical protein [Streptomyces tateyamensis]
MPGPGEPLWLPEDRWWALALLEVEARACRDCGHPSTDTTDPAGEYAYDAEVVRCHACAAGHRRVTALQEQGASTAGLQVHIYRKGAAS